MEPALHAANSDPKVHGIIVYYPIFGGTKQSFSGESQDDYLRDTVDYTRDVEGLCHLYRSNLYRNIRYLNESSNKVPLKCILPCTALSVVKIIEALPNCYNRALPIGQQLKGKTVTILNRSEIVGRPLAAMLANDGATVYSIDIETIYQFLPGQTLQRCDANITPESCVRQSSIVVTGVPTAEYRLQTAWIQKNTAVVNVSSFKNVNETELLKVPGVVYVPLVGKVTVSMLERNLVRLYEQFHAPKDGNAAVNDVLDAAPANSDKSSVLQLVLHAYTAVAVTVLLAVALSSLKK